MRCPTRAPVCRRFKPVFLVLIAALAGCSSGGSENASGESAVFSLLTAGDGTTSYVTEFNEASAQAIRDLPEFKAQGGSLLITLSTGETYVTHNNTFSVINVEYAHSVGLSGSNQLIALIDSGFRTTHQELAGKTIWTYGTFPASYEDHGTGVAAVAAGKNDDAGMMGVAPDASLHFSPLSATLPGFAAATDDAKSKGAVVQNNSWGYVYSTDQSTITVADINASSASSLAGKLADVVGFTAGDWAGYLSALERFSTSGVIVFSASNTAADTSAGVMAGLPTLQPSLLGSWITAINAIAGYDSGGTLNGATRLSAPCLEAAPYCLAAEGVVQTATDTSDSSYGYAAGTSYAAPQVSGAVALLAEAFPNLQPSEIVDRLLASANNSFFTEIDGVVDFGNDVTHSYNEEFGHGFVDLKAALLPIGSLGVATTSAATGPTVPVSQVAMQPGTAQGGAVEDALAGYKLALFDALGTDFYAPADILVSDEEQDDLDERLDRFVRGAGNQIRHSPGSFGFSSEGTGQPNADSSLVFGWAESVGSEFGRNPAASPLFADPSSLLGLAPDARAFGTGRLVSGGSFGFFGFADMAGEDGQTVGFGASRAYRIDSGPTLTLGFTGMTETGSFLGLTLADESTFNTATMAFNSGVSMPLGGFEVFATSEFGLSKTSGAGLMTSVEPALFSGFAVGSRVKGLFNRRDTLTFSVQQPLRIETGQASLRLPVGRTGDGQVLFDTVPVALEPEARQMDFGLDYTTTLSPLTDIRLGVALSLNENHTSGQTGGSMMAAMVHRF